VDVSTITNIGSGSDILAAVRAAITDADVAILAVAFVKVGGVNLLETQIDRLGANARMLVTATFGTTNPAALAMARKLGTSIRVHNSSAGTYHPKIYIGRRGNDATAVIGSATLSGGLVSNVEAAVMLRGTIHDPPIRDAWDFAESLWSHERSVEWSPPIGAPIEEEAFDPELHALIAAAVARTEGMFSTVSQGKPNQVTDLISTGLYVITEQSTSAQFIPAWMFQVAWDYLLAHGQLTHKHLQATDGLNVKRSAAVCAILAALPDVHVVPGSKPVMLVRGAADWRRFRTLAGE
jgi:hypothetical protein